MSALTFVTADAPFTDSGNTAWVLAAAALVLFMTPGLALFYGGMVRTKSVLNMMMMSFITMGTVGTVWILWGYSETFGNDVGGGLIGNPFEHFGLKGVLDAIYGYVPADARRHAGGRRHPRRCLRRLPGRLRDHRRGPRLRRDRRPGQVRHLDRLHGDLGDARLLPRGPLGLRLQRLRGRDGWLDRQQGRGLFLGGVGAYDFAGGTAIHINAGVAGLALAILLRKRVGWPKEPMRPHNLTLVMIGAGILWFGWFGFNAGSALSAGTLASGVWVNTLGATCTAMLGWLITEKIRDGHATSLGAASGVVAGLVAITPACATVSPWGALVVGLAAGVGCALAVGLKFRFGFDDSLDVVGVHLVGGLIGTLLIGFLATRPTARPARPASR